MGGRVYKGPNYIADMYVHSVVFIIPERFLYITNLVLVLLSVISRARALASSQHVSSISWPVHVGFCIVLISDDVRHKLGAVLPVQSRECGVPAQVRLIIRYLTPLDYNGHGWIYIYVSDNGNTGAEGVKTATHLINLTSLAVNDDPVLVLPSMLYMNEEGQISVGMVHLYDVDAQV